MSMFQLLRPSPTAAATASGTASASGSGGTMGSEGGQFDDGVGYGLAGSERATNLDGSDNPAALVQYGEPMLLKHIQSGLFLSSGFVQLRRDDMQEGELHPVVTPRGRSHGSRLESRLGSGSGSEGRGQTTPIARNAPTVGPTHHHATCTPPSTLSRCEAEGAPTAHPPPGQVLLPRPSPPRDHFVLRVPVRAHREPWTDDG